MENMRKKGTNWEILYLNNRRLVRLQVRVILQNSLCTDGDWRKPYKKNNFWVTSHFN